MCDKTGGVKRCFVYSELFSRKYSSVAGFSSMHLTLPRSPIYDDKQGSYCKNLVSNFDLPRKLRDTPWSKNGHSFKQKIDHKKLLY